MPDLIDWSQTDRAILTDSVTFRARFRQILVQAALNISSETDGARTRLARSVISSPDTHTQTMIATAVVNLTGTSDAEILNAIGGIWDAHAGG